MQVSLEIALQILVNLGALAMIYTRLETKIAVIQTKLTYIERALKLGGDSVTV
jgi:hypothetical protein